MSLTNEQAALILQPEINTLENRQALINAGDNAEGIAPALDQLRQVNPYLVTESNFQALIAAGANAGGIAWALGELRWTSPDLVTEGNFRALIAAGDNAEGIAYALGQLRRANPDLVTEGNFQALIAAGPNAGRTASALGQLGRANPGLLTEDNFRVLIAAGADVDQAALVIIQQLHIAAAPEPPVERPAPLHHIPWEFIPRPEPGNERQRILVEIGADEREERVNTLLDPVTLEAIEHPRLLTGDTTGQYFEYHTLMALERTADGTFAHPLTRVLYTEAQIEDASVEYEELFNKTVADIRAEQAPRLRPA